MSETANGLGPLGAGTHTSYEVPIPAELVEALAVRVAELVVERLTREPEGYLDVEAAAEHLACPKSRVYELVRAGRVTHRREGRRVVFRRSDLDELLTVHEAGS